jgi:hypothetical protein
MERHDVEGATADAPARAQRTRSRWKKLRAATLVFLLLRRRGHHDKRHSNKQQQHKRMPTSVFFAKPSVQAATAAAAQRLWANPLPAAASPHVTRWFEQKMKLFERLVRKPCVLSMDRKWVLVSVLTALRGLQHSVPRRRRHQDTGECSKFDMSIRFMLSSECCVHE